MKLINLHVFQTRRPRLIYLFLYQQEAIVNPPLHELYSLSSQSLSKVNSSYTYFLGYRNSENHFQILSGPDIPFLKKVSCYISREYVNSSEWDIEETHAKRHVRYYPCCDDEPYPDLTFYLTIRRRPAFYIYVLILPSVLLSVLTLVLFWIPPQRPDRTALGNSHLTQS